jgi:hypothetical protein
MRTRTGTESLASRGSTARNDGLHSVDGGSSGQVPGFLATTEEFSTGAGEPIGNRKDSVSETSWFAPVETKTKMNELSDCPGGVCPVPWAVTESAPVSLPDIVNHPSHYTDGEIECIEAIEASLTPEEYRGYLKGNIQKYVWRERLKGGTESLRKAQWYIERLIQLDEIQKG